MSIKPKHMLFIKHVLVESTLNYKDGKNIFYWSVADNTFS